MKSVNPNPRLGVHPWMSPLVKGLQQQDWLKGTVNLPGDVGEKPGDLGPGDRPARPGDHMTSPWMGENIPPEGDIPINAA